MCSVQHRLLIQNISAAGIKSRSKASEPAYFSAGLQACLSGRLKVCLRDRSFHALFSLPDAVLKYPLCFACVETSSAFVRTNEEGCRAAARKRTSE